MRQLLDLELGKNVWPLVKLGRGWGCTAWGIGHQSRYYNRKDVPAPAISHVDGICLKRSVTLDEVEVTREDRVIHPQRAKLAQRIRNSK